MSARRSRSTRAARRRRSAAPPSAPAPGASAITPSRVLFFAWCVAVVALFSYTALGIERKITWYLAVDQYGYLTFAHDLLHGRVFHHSVAIDALAPRLPEKVDVLSQTYVYDHGRLYCRYAPGFAVMLAAWLALFGDDGAPHLNPTVYLALLAVVLAFQVRIFRSRWRALAGVALIGLVPTKVDWWSLTLVRDLPTHLSALVGLYLLLPVGGRRLTPRRTAAAGLALGWAVSIRPDAVLYLVPATCVVAARWWRERPRLRPLLRVVAAGALGVALGMAPFLAYNWAARGNPFRPTQGMEVESFAAAPRAPSPDPPMLARVGYPSGAWHGGTIAAVQGGGLRLSNLRGTLPGNVKFFRDTYTDVLVGLALWGAVIALLRHRMLFLTAVPYAVVALLFFSCWPRPDDSRYLAGVHCLVPMLIAEGVFGTLDAVRALRRAGHEIPARVLASVFGLVMLAGAVATHVPQPELRNTALPTLVMVAPGIAGAAALAAALWPRVRVARWAAPALAIAIVVLACSRSARAAQSRARFQRPEMLRARATFARVVEPGSVVITVEDVGRPGENIDYYSRVAQAFYMTDLTRWNLQVGDAAQLLARAGLKSYLFIPFDQPGRDFLLARLRQQVGVELVKDVPPPDAMDHFVAASFHPGGVHMLLYRLTPKQAAP